MIHKSGLNRNILTALIIAAGLMCTLFPVCPGNAWAVSPRYMSIIERNPFDPERGKNQDASEQNTVSSRAEELKKKYSVYGVIITGQNKTAYIKPLKPEKRGKKSELKQISVGDMIDGWKVKDITDSGIVVISGREQLLLSVFGSAKKERKSTKPVAAMTPKLFPTKPQSRRPEFNNPNIPKVKPRFIFPKNKNSKQTINPFLKALQMQRAKERELKRAKEMEIKQR